MKESTNRGTKGLTKKATNLEAKVAAIVADKEATISAKMVALNRLQIPATKICQMLGNKRPQHFRNVVQPYCVKNGIPYNTYNGGTKKASIDDQLAKWNL